MEDILDKNIFCDSDLLKLSPDYVPSNTLLRLQIRRNMVKDTHIHGSFTYNYGKRKTTKLSKDRVKMNKEMDKLRNSFYNMNLRNEIMIKNNVSNAPLKTIAEDNASILNPIVEIERLSVSDQVSLYNSRNSKLNTNLRKSKIVNISKPTTELLRNEENMEEFENIIDDFAVSIEYKDHALLDDIDDTHAEINTEKEPEYNDCNNLSVTNSRDMNTGSQMADLQSVLIMMAINSNFDEKENTNVALAKEEVVETSINPEDLVLVSNSIQKELHADFLNITPLRLFVTGRQNMLTKKYIEKWKSYVEKRREYIIKQRQETINNFFDKLEKKKTDLLNPSSESKSKLLARDYSTYQHRYKMQKHIIALQKAKLEEQNRVIDELKYNKIIDASKHSVDDMKEEVRKAYFELDRHLKPKMKLLTNELKIPEIEETSLVLHCLKVPQFLQRMEKRAREREEKHAMIRERRKQMEEERIRLKQQAELAKLEMDKEEKLKRLKELREKRKRDRIESIRKKQYADRMRSLTVMADLHYERSLMAKYCIRPLKLLLQLKRDNLEKAKAHYKFQLQKNVFLHWMFYTEDKIIDRNYRAEKFHRTKILKVVFAGLKANHHEYVLKRQVAEDYYDLYATQLVFRKLREGIAVLKKENEIIMQKAILYHNRNLLFKILTCWRTLPALNALKREQEARKARWREKVLQVVPDYMPPDE